MGVLWLLRVPNIICKRLRKNRACLEYGCIAIYDYYSYTKYMMYSDLITVQNSMYKITAYDDGLISFTKWAENERVIRWHHVSGVTGDYKDETIFNMGIISSYQEDCDFNFTQSWHMITMQTSLLDKAIKVIELIPLLREQWEKWVN